MTKNIDADQGGKKSAPKTLQPPHLGALRGHALNPLEANRFSPSEPLRVCSDFELRPAILGYGNICTSYMLRARLAVGSG
jgi:hypothetical protein